MWVGKSAWSAHPALSAALPSDGVTVVSAARRSARRLMDAPFCMGDGKPRSPHYPDPAGLSPRPRPGSTGGGSERPWHSMRLGGCVPVKEVAGDRLVDAGVAIGDDDPVVVVVAHHLDDAGVRERVEGGERPLDRRRRIAPGLQEEIPAACARFERRPVHHVPAPGDAGEVGPPAAVQGISACVPVVLGDPVGQGARGRLVVADDGVLESGRAGEVHRPGLVQDVREGARGQLVCDRLGGRLERRRRHEGVAGDERQHLRHVGSRVGREEPLQPVGGGEREHVVRALPNLPRSSIWLVAACRWRGERAVDPAIASTSVPRPKTSG